MDKVELKKLLESTIDIAKEAGKLIADVYQANKELVVEMKTDGSPLTIADRLAHGCIVKGLTELTPEYPILSEEDADILYSDRLRWDRYWLVDPLDGTKEFIHRLDDFTVNIALIERNQVVMGVVYAPISEACYYAAQDIGAFKQSDSKDKESICSNSYAGGKLKIVASRRHGLSELEKFLGHLDNYEIQHRGSSLKICTVAEGKADLYPRLGLTSEWDTAAAQCVLEQAGGKLMDFKGFSLQYNRRESLQNPPFLAVGDPSYSWLELFKQDEK